MSLLVHIQRSRGATGTLLLLIASGLLPSTALAVCRVVEEVGSTTPAVLPDQSVLLVQPQVATGPDGASFALLMVTPEPPWITLQDRGVFDSLARDTGRRVEYVDTYVEDPAMGYQCHDPSWTQGMGPIPSPTADASDTDPLDDATTSSSGGCLSFGGSSSWEPPVQVDTGGKGDKVYDSDGEQDTGVLVHQVGAYDIAVLDRPDLGSIGRWLTEHGYAHRQEDLDALAPYVAQRYSVVAVRVRTDASYYGTLAPIGFTWPGTERRVPVAVSHADSSDPFELTTYLVGEKRRFVLPTADAPTYAGRWSGSNTYQVVRQVLRTRWSTTADEDPFAEEVPADTEVLDVEYVPRTIRIPLSECPSASVEDDDVGGPGPFCGCSAGAGLTPRATAALLALAWAVRRRRSGGSRSGVAGR